MWLPADEPLVEIFNDAKDEFEIDGAVVVFCSGRVEAETHQTSVMLRLLMLRILQLAGWL